FHPSMSFIREGDPIVRMACRQCNYSRDLTDREAEFGMLCPECHCQYLRPPLRSRRPGEFPSVRPATVRALIGGVCLLFLGVPLAAYGYRHFAGPGLGPRLFAYGIVLAGAGLISLITGSVLLVYDLTQE
ncbi:MAG: hypothetical protein ACRC33_11335, partial [Gemmataceae bacterium]